VSDVQVQRRRAIEALRAGVPNRDAVQALGSLQTAVEYCFDELLKGFAAMASGSDRPQGMVINGGFGTGKSHLLEYLQHRALDARFVVSKVVVSKETPLYDPVKLVKAAAQAARVPGKAGAGLQEVALGLRPDSKAYADLFRWCSAPDIGINGRFAASLYLYEYLKGGDEEFLDTIVRFWSGEPIRVPELRSRLKDAGQSGTFTFSSAPERLLAMERLRFLPRLVQAAGYAGWILLIDEVELIGRYSVLQRAKSYAEVARLMLGPNEDLAVPVGAVLACTDDFGAEVLQPSGKDDLEMVPRRLLQRQTVEDEVLAARANIGMQLLDRDAMVLQPPDYEELDRTYERLKQVHGEAYDWSPPDVVGIERLGTNRMRQYVRAWINEWDLRRLDPGYQPDIEVDELGFDYTEDRDLEKPSAESYAT